jgi:heme-degrading monooxygenase HmoA
MTQQDNSTPGIARIWRGRTARDRADEYLRYWREEGGLHPLDERALAVQMLREDCGDITEFTTISWWPSVDSMAAFTGGDPMQVHHLSRDPEFLLELPERVQVLNVTNATWPMAEAKE